MNSYISNSRKNIFIVILTFIFLFLLYNLFIYIIKPNVVMGQSQWERNLIKIEDFMYNDSVYDMMTVGSSMTAKIKIDDVNFYNLSFAGSSPLLGLEVILNKKQIPKVLLFEINVMDNNSNQKLMKSISYKYLNFIKTYIPALRITYQPINVLISTIKKNDINMSKTKVDVVNNELIEKLLINLKNKNSHIPDNEIAIQIYNKINSNLDLLRKRGVKIIFLEMPVHESIMNLPRIKFIREYAKQKLLKNGDIWIDNDKFTDYQTTDGVHLTYESLNRYQIYLKSQIQNIFNE